MTQMEKNEIGFDGEKARYQLSGEVETNWEDSEEAALEAYNNLVEKHNQRYKRESNHFAFLEKIPCSGGCYEIIEEGLVRHQWPNPSQDHGMVYLEVQTEADDKRR